MNATIGVSKSSRVVPGRVPLRPQRARSLVTSSASSNLDGLTEAQKSFLLAPARRQAELLAGNEGKVR